MKMMVMMMIMMMMIIIIIIIIQKNNLTGVLSKSQSSGKWRRVFIRVIPEYLTHYARCHLPDDLQILLGQSSQTKFWNKFLKKAGEDLSDRSREKVLHTVKEKKNILNAIKRRKVNWIRHTCVGTAF
jgi:hypothetical protein